MIKQDRVNQIMEIQSELSWQLNQKCIGKKYNCLIDRKDGDFYIARTFMDSPDVDNEVHIDGTKNYLKTGSFKIIKIIDATDHDLIGIPSS